MTQLLLVGELQCIVQESRALVELALPSLIEPIMEVCPAELNIIVVLSHLDCVFLLLFGHILRQ